MGIIAFAALSTVVFTGLILFIVGLLTYAEGKLVKTGPVTITINDEDVIEVPAGGTLLSTLAAKKVFIPSACGGGGTCAQCRCQVLEGGGDVIATELNHLSRSEVKDHVRLACQVKVRGDMKIHVPDEIFKIRKYDCVVTANSNVATFIKELNLKMPDGESLIFNPGEYIQIEIPQYKIAFKTFDIQPEYHPDWDKFNLWRYTATNNEDIFRAYSMANYPAEKDIVKLNVRIATPPPKRDDIPPGVASSYIFNLKPGDKVTISGPYGDFHIKETGKEMVYIGGGAGMAPLRSHTFHLFKTLRTNRKVTFYYGARSLREVFYWDEFQEIEREFPNFRFVLALSEPLPEDNWTGPVGFIHNVAHEDYLKTHPDPTDLEFYLCGPPPMLNAVNKMLFDIGVEPEQIAYDAF